MTTSMHDTARPSVAIILVNWNNASDTIQCIDTLLAQRYANAHIFVVDNDSSDRSVERIDEWCAAPRAEPTWSRHEGVDRATDRIPIAPVVCRTIHWRDDATASVPQANCRLTVIRSGGNLGFAGGCNVGVRVAGLDSFEYFWFLNSDTVVHRFALDALVRRALEDRSIGMVGSTLRDYDLPDKVQAMGGAHLNRVTTVSRHIGQGCHIDEVPRDRTIVERELAYIFGASMLVAGRFIREIGLMQEDYFLYYEEIDWAMRGSGRFKLGYAPDSHVFHKAGASSSKKMPAFTARLYYRNRIRFVGRFLPDRLLAAKRRIAFEILYYLCKRQWHTAYIVAAVLWDARNEA